MAVARRLYSKISETSRGGSLVIDRVCEMLWQFRLECNCRHRFRNDAHTELDSQVGRNFVIKNERHRRYFSFADVSIRKIYSSLSVKKKKSRPIIFQKKNSLKYFLTIRDTVIIEFSYKKKILKCSKQMKFFVSTPS